MIWRMDAVDGMDTPICVTTTDGITPSSRSPLDRIGTTITDVNLGTLNGRVINTITTTGLSTGHPIMDPTGPTHTTIPITVPISGTTETITVTTIHGMTATIRMITDVMNGETVNGMGETTGTIATLIIETTETINTIE